MTDAAWEQATLGVKSHGGLGLRDARSLALSAFLASRIVARPHVRELASHMEQCGLAASLQIVEAFDKRTDMALSKLVSLLDMTTGGSLVDTLTSLADAAQRQWDSLFDTDGEELVPERGVRTPAPPGLGAGLVPADEDGDPEHPESTTRTTTLHIQKTIYVVVDRRRSASILDALASEGDFSGIRRLQELGHTENDHSWLWALSKHKGPVLDAPDYIEGVRMRLGIAGPDEPVPCQLCGVVPFGGAGSHAHCCSRAQSTRGHNCVVRGLLAATTQCDPNAELEARGLIPGTDLRPADVLTGCLNHGLTALDVGIASPDADAAAGTDCVAAMYSRKVEYYAPHRDALDRQNIEYQPVTWSAYGRPHPQTTAILRTLATRLARRRGCSDAEWRYRRLRAGLVTEIWRRGAKMVRSCWPDLEGD